MKFARPIFLLAWGICAWLALETTGLACPFCPALEPTLAQRRETADVVALGELLEASGTEGVFRLHHAQKGTPEKAKRRIASNEVRQLQAGSLALLFGDRQKADTADDLAWSVEPANELQYAYLARAPSLREKTAERLRYFAGYLEHADETIAEDAFQEFAHASLDDVAAAAGALDGEKLRAWLLDETVPGRRKGFYALALSLIPDASQREKNAAFLRNQIENAGDDFAAGLDGVMGGYLTLRGEEALELIERRFLTHPDAATGHVRHALSALRYYREFGREISDQRLGEALAHLLSRPEFLADTLGELARLEHWQATERIVGRWGQPVYDAPDIKLAILGYLLVCPTPEAKRELERIRKLDPETVRKAERYFSLIGGTSS